MIRIPIHGSGRVNGDRPSGGVHRQNRQVPNLLLGNREQLWLHRLILARSARRGPIRESTPKLEQANKKQDGGKVRRAARLRVALHGSRIMHPKADP